MANTGTFTGEAEDGNVKIAYEIAWQVSGNTVNFAARALHVYRWAAWNNSMRQYVFAAAQNEFMTLSVDGSSGAGIKFMTSISYGTPASGSGWREMSGTWSASEVNLPLKGGYYAIRLEFYGNGGKTITETLLIAGASTISLSGSRILGEEQTITISKASPDLKDTITYECGDASGTIVSASLQTSFAWTPPMSLASEYTASRNLPITFTVTTYSGDEEVGTGELTETLVVPDNDSTKPSLSVSVSPVNTGLPAKFAALYIQGKSGASVDFTASAKYGASLVSYTAIAEGKQYSGDPATTDILNISGSSNISSTVLDSRGLTKSAINTITVQSYTPPAVIPYTGENEIKVERSDEDGVPSTSGTYLHIKAGKKISPVNDLNTGVLSYRWKLQSAAQYGAWVTLASSSDFAEVILSGIVTDTHLAYDIQLRAADDIGEEHIQSFTILTDEIPLHLAYGGSAVGLGRYADTSKGRSVQSAWPIYAEDGIYIGNVPILDYFYPVGTVYRTTDSAFDPEEHFGGTWSQTADGWERTE